MSEPVTPVEVRAPEGARRLEIDWSDGVTTAYRHAILRGFCPCAHCQGHHGPVAWVEGADELNLELASIEEVGTYALQFGWGDGHATGIYTFRFLRALAEIGESESAFVRGRSFMR
ncbi:MAG: DUF971 domain-containing protein [Sandaracinaceae bacterium]|nr:DUF971 domain-containing protein [Sandaracinaceae bacterium]